MFACSVWAAALAWFLTLLYKAGMLTLREARALGDSAMEQFIAEREAEGMAEGDADKLEALTRRLSETPKSVQRTSKREPSAD